jgi:hypothetical protein
VYVEEVSLLTARAGLCQSLQKTCRMTCLSHNFAGESVFLSLVSGFYVLHWHSTKPGAAHPSG